MSHRVPERGRGGGGHDTDKECRHPPAPIEQAQSRTENKLAAPGRSCTMTSGWLPFYFVSYQWEGGYQGYVTRVIKSKPNQLHTHNPPNRVRVSAAAALGHQGHPSRHHAINNQNSLSSVGARILFSSFIPRLAIPAAFHHIGRSLDPGAPTDVEE